MKFNKKLHLILGAAILSAAFVMTGCEEKEVPLAELKTDKYVTLGQYTGLSASATMMEVDETTYNNYIDYILSSNVTYEEVTGRPAQMGDVANIDYTGTKDGVAFEGGTAQGHNLTLGSGSFIPGFEEGVVGMETGEEKDIDLTFPDPYPGSAELAGAAVTFRVKLNGISQRITPEFDDEFAKSHSEGRFDNAKDYKAYLRERLEINAKQNFDAEIERALITQIEESSAFKKEPPEYLVSVYKNRIIDTYNLYAAQAGVSLEELLQAYYGMTVDDFNKEVSDQSVSSAKQAIILQAIANNEGIKVSEADIEDKLKRDAELAGFRTVDEYRAELGEDDYSYYTLYEKVLAFIKEKSTITEEEQ